MERVPIHELKRRLSQVIAAAEAGQTLLVTRHRRVVARIVPPEPQLHRGRQFGRGKIRAVLNGPTRGRYLDIIADDRRGGVADESR